MPLMSQPQYKAKHMGDKSPKATQKKSTQKQTKVSSADLKKKQATLQKDKPNSDVIKIAPATQQPPPKRR